MLGKRRIEDVDPMDFEAPLHKDKGDRSTGIGSLG
jgi:hypothetical protein